MSDTETKGGESVSRCLCVVVYKQSFVCRHGKYKSEFVATVPQFNWTGMMQNSRRTLAQQWMLAPSGEESDSHQMPGRQQAVPCTVSAGHRTIDSSPA